MVDSNKKEKPCICKENDPCDYHAVTCITCGFGGCKGHPYTGYENRRQIDKREE